MFICINECLDMFIRYINAFTYGSASLYFCLSLSMIGSFIFIKQTTESTNKLQVTTTILNDSHSQEWNFAIPHLIALRSGSKINKNDNLSCKKHIAEFC